MGNNVLNKRGAGCVKKGTGNVFAFACEQHFLLVSVVSVLRGIFGIQLFEVLQRPS